MMLLLQQQQALQQQRRRSWNPSSLRTTTRPGLPVGRFKLLALLVIIAVSLFFLLLIQQQQQTLVLVDFQTTTTTTTQNQHHRQFDVGVESRTTSTTTTTTIPRSSSPMQLLHDSMEEKGIQTIAYNNHRYNSASTYEDNNGISDEGNSKNVKNNMNNKPILITFANYKGWTQFGAHFCETIHTAIVNDWEVYVLGWGSFPSLFPSRAKFAKIPTLLQFLRSLEKLNPNQIFMFMDAYDVVVLGSPQEALDKFLKASSTYQADIIIGTETTCYPFNRDPTYGQHELCEKEYPRVPHSTATDAKDAEYRYLNAGVWMGYTDTAITFLEGMMMIDQIRIPSKGKTTKLLMTDGDDQAHFHYAFMSGKYSISLDYNNTLFASMGSTRNDMILEEEEEETEEASSSFAQATETETTRKRRRRWKNRRFNTSPITLHFNGNKVDYLDYYAKTLVVPSCSPPHDGGGGASVRRTTNNNNNGIQDYYKNTEDKQLKNLHGVNFNRVCKWGWFI